jgi:2-C-methyl-D-erythritol 2,4-cyclodiphosphate synthase
VVNLDATVVAQQPKLNAFLLPMRQSIASVFQVPLSCVNVKAKTNEKLGYLGRGQAIEAQAVVLMQYDSQLAEAVNV